MTTLSRSRLRGAGDTWRLRALESDNALLRELLAQPTLPHELQ